MATKITYPDKVTGDTIAASEFDQIKPAVNSLIDEVNGLSNLHPQISASLDLSNLIQTELSDGLKSLDFILDRYTGELFSFKQVDVLQNPTSADGVIYILIEGVYYKRQYTGYVNVRWFGAIGDGVVDDSVAVQKAIDAFRGIGATILFPEGTFCMKDIQVPKGISLVSLQMARDNFLSDVQSKIRPYTGATYVFEYEDDAKNCLMDGLYIDGDYSTFPLLTAAVRWAGTFNKITNCNITRCAQYAVKSKCGGFELEFNNIQGWYGAAPTDWIGPNDFRGALHAEAMGDSYVLNNEIGAGLSYFTSTVTPRDPVHGRIVAMSLGNIFGGTSVISGNLFENGDRSVAIGNSLYCRFSKNRYELSAMGGLYIYGPMQFVVFENESFSDNSLSVDGAADDITIATGAAGNIAFIAPIFESLVNGAIPNSNFKVKYHISNYGSTLIDLVTPIIDPIYSTNGLINLTDVGTLPIRQVAGQYDPNNPIWLSVSTKQPVTETQKGWVELTQGSANTAAEGDPDNSLIGGVQYFDSEGNPKVIIGFNPGNDIWVRMLGDNGTFIVLDGPIHTSKAGGNSLKAISTDLEGIVSVSLEAGPIANFVFNAFMDATNGNTTINCNSPISIGTLGNIRIMPNGETYFDFEFPGGTPATTKIMAVNTSTRELVSIDPSLMTTGYTVSTLPAGTVGMTAYVTDATAPTYMGALTGGGTVVVPVFHDGTSWKSH